MQTSFTHTDSTTDNLIDLIILDSNFFHMLIAYIVNNLKFVIFPLISTIFIKAQATVELNVLWCFTIFTEVTIVALDVSNLNFLDMDSKTWMSANRIQKTALGTPDDRFLILHAHNLFSCIAGLSHQIPK